MGMVRRWVLGVLAGLVQIAASEAVLAQDMSRTGVITFVVGYPAGGGADVMARLLASSMSKTLGQSIIVENRPGASGQIAAAGVAKASPDGLTVLVDAASFAINPALQPKLNYDPKSLRPLGVVALFPHVLVVTPSYAAKSVQDLVERAKASPGKIDYASSGMGSAQHFAGALFTSRAGLKLTHLAYRGGSPAMNDVIAGHVNVFFANIASSLSFIEGGQLRALGIAGDQRSAKLPDVPTFDEAGVKGASFYEWNGFFVPTATPEPIAKRLADALENAKQSPEVRDRIVALGGEVFAGGADRAADFIATETGRMRAIATEANITLQ